jgi:omega-6 fatty acid desaturase (delta-12 desaturase)
LIRADFPEYIRYDSTPIHVALWRVALNCSYVVKNNQDGAYYYN